MNGPTTPTIGVCQSSSYEATKLRLKVVGFFFPKCQNILGMTNPEIFEPAGPVTDRTSQTRVLISGLNHKCYKTLLIALDMSAYFLSFQCSTPSLHPLTLLDARCSPRPIYSPWTRFFQSQVFAAKCSLPRGNLSLSSHPGSRKTNFTQNMVPTFLLCDRSCCC